MVCGWHVGHGRIQVLDSTICFQEASQALKVFLGSQGCNKWRVGRSLHFQSVLVFESLSKAHIQLLVRSPK